MNNDREDKSRPEGCTGFENLSPHELEILDRMTGVISQFLPADGEDLRDAGITLTHALTGDGTRVAIFDKGNGMRLKMVVKVVKMAEDHSATT